MLEKVKKIYINNSGAEGKVNCSNIFEYTVDPGIQ